MKEFRAVAFDPAQCREELDRFKALLDSKEELSERDDLRPLFTNSPQLIAFIGTSFPSVALANRLAYEFKIFGDFSADVVIGNKEKRIFCAIELEDASASSVFGKLKGKVTTEWGPRFEHGFSQLVDWFFSLDDHRDTAAFTNSFGDGHIGFFGMLLIGRSGHLSEYDRRRLMWRTDRVAVNSHKIVCRTYDELYDALNDDWRWSSLNAGP